MRHASRRLLAALLLSVCVLALPACDSDGGDEPDGVTGAWRAEVDGANLGMAGSSAVVTMDLTESDGDQVSGSGEITAEAGPGTSASLDFDVEGTAEEAEVSLTLMPEIEDFNAAQFEGVRVRASGEDRLVGTMSGLTPTEAPVTFERQ